MLWGLGSTWGLSSLWGAAGGPGPQEFCDLADQRVLVQMDDQPGNRNFRDLVCVLVKPLGTFRDVCVEIIDGAFDLDSTTGAGLDTIGEIVGLAREGEADDRYRTLLRIQIELILSSGREGAEWTGTSENILRICRLFIGDTPGQSVVLINTPPYDFTLGVPTITLANADRLFRFLCKALYAGVLGNVKFALQPNSRWDSVSVPVAQGGVYCSVSVPVPGCAQFGTVRTIGNCKP